MNVMLVSSIILSMNNLLIRDIEDYVMPLFKKLRLVMMESYGLDLSDFGTSLDGIKGKQTDTCSKGVKRSFRDFIHLYL